MRARDVLVAGLLALVSLVPGQSRADDVARARAQDALDSSDRRIALAGSFLAASSSATARAELAAARQEQARARSAFTAVRYQIAVDATLTAREHSDRAIAIVHNLPDPERVRTQVERTRDVLDRAGDRVGACGDSGALGMLHVALTMQGRAEGAMAESRYLAALQLTMSARERVMKAMQMCKLDESPSQSAARALWRTDDVLARARETLDSGSPPAVRDMLGRAQSIQAQAQAEARLGRYETALRLSQGARSLARRAVRPERVLRGSPGR